MSRRNVALFGATIVSVILNTFTIAKDVMPQYIDAYGFFYCGMAPYFCFGSLVVMPKKKLPTIFHELLRHSLVSLLTCLPF
jgi:hypothetical protein